MANRKKCIRNNIQKYRIWKGLFQKDLAELTGISLSELRLIEKNKVTPRTPIREKLIQYFDVSHDQLFYHDEM